MSREPFFRPDSIVTLLRWRELLVALAVIALGLYWIATSFGVLYWIGWVALAGGVALAVEAGRRLRFPGRGGGLGVVEVVEGQITYLAPEHGGAVAFSLLERVELARRGGRLTWRFTSEGGETLAIPGDAEGAERLRDVLTALPGADFAAVSRAAQAGPDRVELIWERTPERVPEGYRLQ